MLVIPLTEKLSWKNPPFITIFLILANVFIFLGFQLHDNENYYKAEQYYFEAGLAKIEIPKYQEYIKENKKEINSDPVDNKDSKEVKKDSKEAVYKAYRELQCDKTFLEKLRNDKIITENDDHYFEWKALRENYESKAAAVIASEYGFKPAYHRPFTLLSSMFLHGGFGHLIGNMLFLWIAGCLVEAGSKRGYYITAYILSGFSAVALFWVLNVNSVIPYVGASGAISGLMGIITTLYGTKKIKVFFSVGFYFNYLRAPAILLLPIWVAKELWAYYLGGPSNTAYMAHVGGFLGGAALGYLNIKLLKFVNYDALTEKKESKTPQYLEQAMEYSGKLEFDKAREILEQAYKEAPEDTMILEQLFKTVKIDPESKQFHVTTKKILSLLSKNRTNYDLVYQIYVDYTSLVKMPKLPAKLFIKLCSIFSTMGHTDKAEKILVLFLKKKPDMPQVSDAVFKLALAFKKKENIKKYDYYKKILYAKYPESNETRNMKQIN
ncbi:MAG: rhomboid family intramembrane serine protease [Desulfobacteraceae bacterium]|nr:rhomboid family intramembrane serine protease [Desulfobacteraceae bacterium]